ncbi:transcriptional repressor [Acinetobacter sp. RF14B]|uniref:transcriptional repressor n=1 Tax=Acinetobacter sp. RF14B TaxID=2650965 RepID=UPI001D0DBD6D|nr:transcriptional repressor [Acinetobacter sp. RF14B]
MVLQRRNIPVVPEYQPILHRPQAYPQRAKVVRPAGEEIHVDYDLLAQMKNASDRPAAPPTVYRTLDFLLEKGFIHRLTSINAYIPCCHPREGHQAAFLICTACKAVKEASAQDLLNQLDALAASDGFSSHHSIIEISGTCQQCQNKA